VYRIRTKKAIIKQTSNEKRTIEKPRLPRTARKMSTTELVDQMDAVGVDVDKSDEVRSFTFTILMSHVK
jgi:hypothetical protein